MSLIYKSPMAKKFQIFFFIWTLIVMASFAGVGISIAYIRWNQAFVFLAVAVLMAGFGFMIRKRVLRAMGEIKPKQ
ncbi:hypothetical protein [Tumebacillus flagellatus]|uniref:Uncharacterized protein n=1 Tax=Tumebacillus flagellatus TaxID=1157490 RepID=A0A074MFI1_9BACL|nr:hypothetical protein [Tumebacillus flagellatus]KEO84527.1 hypothetical protein EL26_03125 [Tumebacillus flagellatus]